MQQPFFLHNITHMLLWNVVQNKKFSIHGKWIRCIYQEMSFIIFIPYEYFKKYQIVLFRFVLLNSNSKQNYLHLKIFSHPFLFYTKGKPRVHNGIKASVTSIITYIWVYSVKSSQGQTSAQSASVSVFLSTNRKNRRETETTDGIFIYFSLSAWHRKQSARPYLLSSRDI